MPYVQRDQDGKIIGRFNVAQEGTAEEYLEDSNPEIQALVDADAQREENAKQRAYLTSTDWYVTRLVETGTAIPDEIKGARQAAREAIQGV